MQINFLKEQLDVAIFKIKVLKQQEDQVLETLSSRDDQHQQVQVLDFLENQEQTLSNELNLIESSLKELRSLKLSQRFNL